MIQNWLLLPNGCLLPIKVRETHHFACLFAWSFAQLFAHLFSCSFICLPTQYFACLFACWFTCSFTCSLSHLIVHSFAHLLACSSLAHLLVCILFCLLINLLVHFLVCLLVQTNPCSHSQRDAWSHSWSNACSHSQTEYHSQTQSKAGYDSQMDACSHSRWERFMNLLACSPAHLFACSLNILFACLLACLLAHLLACFLIWLLIHLPTKRHWLATILYFCLWSCVSFCISVKSVLASSSMMVPSVLGYITVSVVRTVFAGMASTKQTSKWRNKQMNTKWVSIQANQEMSKFMNFSHLLVVLLSVITQLVHHWKGMNSWYNLSF